MVQGSIMKTTIIILSFFLASAIGQGVKKIQLVIGNWPGCGGVNIGIKIQSGRNECSVVPKSSVYGGSLASWLGADLGSCAPFHVDGGSRVYFQTDQSILNPFCPQVANIYIDDEDNTMYQAKGSAWNRYYYDGRNNIAHGVTKQWPRDGMYIRPESEPLLCPPLFVDSCPLTEMYAYRIGSRDRKNCLFECNTVTSVSKTTNYTLTKETGFRCVEVGYDSIQFDWCCKTKSTQGGIPRCDESMMTGSLDQSPTPATTAAPEVAEIPSQPFAVPIQCPQSGCPIRNVKTYYDVQEPHAYEVCEIRYECGYVSSASPYDPNSGMECTQTNSPRRKALKCCNHPTAESDLPQCSAVGNRNPPVQNNQPQGSLADGCPTSTRYQPPLETVENPEDWRRAAVRCCSHDGNQCVTPKTPCLFQKSFEEAKEECNTRGMRICKREELSGGICCNTGDTCFFDGALVWQIN